MNTVLKLPLVNVKWQMKRDTEGNSQGEPSKTRDIPSRDGHVYVRVEAEESCVLRVELTRTTLQGGKVWRRRGRCVVRLVGMLCVRREGQVVGICCVRSEGEGVW